MALLSVVALMLTQQDLQIANYPQLDTAQVFEGDFLVHRVRPVAKVYRGPGEKELTLDNGLIRRTFRFDPAGATVGLYNMTTKESFLRSVKPEALLTINGQEYQVGGLTGQPNQAFLKPEWLADMTAPENAFQLSRVSVGTCSEILKWKEERPSEGNPWPARGIQLTMMYTHPLFLGLLVEVKYEMYDGIPVMMKRLVIRNNSNRQVKIDRYTSEILGVVEASSEVEGATVVGNPNLEVITDYSFGGMDHRTSDKGSALGRGPGLSHAGQLPERDEVFAEE